MELSLQSIQKDRMNHTKWQHQFLAFFRGMGNDMYGGDQTRAIEDALRHSSIPMFEALDIPHSAMDVRVTVGLPDPEAIDIPALTATLPRGNASVTAVKGGMRIENPDTGNVTIVASAAIEAFLPSPK